MSLQRSRSWKDFRCQSERVQKEVYFGAEKLQKEKPIVQVKN